MYNSITIAFIRPTIYGAATHDTVNLSGRPIGQQTNITNNKTVRGRVMKYAENIHTAINMAHQSLVKPTMHRALPMV